MRTLDESLTPTDYKVLLVDDDPATLRLLSCWLTRAGYSVRIAADGQEGLDAIELECPNIIITDWEMPRVNGLELCRRIREMLLPHYAYLLFLTVRTSPAEIIRGLETGADDFLAKPVSEGELLARLRSGSRMLQLERRLSSMANVDSLTGLMNQRTFYESMAKEWQRAKRFHLPLSCVMIDLDFFKRINDVHGHSVGDSVLRCAAELLLDSGRASDLVCRYGGEEFCALLPETGENDAATWAERTRQRLASLRLPGGCGDIRLTGSFGVAQCCDDTQNSEQLVDLADQALLCAKRAGRDRVVRYAMLTDDAELEPQSTDQQGNVFQGVFARDIMQPLVVCLRDDETVHEAADFLLQAGIPSTPVVDAEGVLAGFLSEKDLMPAMISRDFWRQPIHDVMRPNVISYEEDTPIRVIYEFLCRVSIRRVVITREGCPTGTISRGLLLRWFRNHATASPVENGCEPCSV